MTIQGLNVRIVDGPVDEDVTKHVDEIGDMTRSAVGGFGESAQFELNLPRHTFPALGEQSRVIVTSNSGAVIWEGFASDPGPIEGAAGESFRVTALGSMVLASDRVEPLVYVDAEPGSWVVADGGVESGQFDSIENGFRLGHPEGQPITDGSYVAAEWRLLEHSSQDVAQIRFDMKCGLTSSNYGLNVFSINDAGVATIVTFWGASTTKASRTVTLPAGTRVVQLRWARSSGGATNVTDDLAWCEVTGPVVIGSRMTVHGVAATPSTSVSSADVVADLIARGVLAGVDPAAAEIEASTVSHTQLSYADGARGAKILADLREKDPEMLWGYGARGDNGYAFWWRKWATDESHPRYTFSDLDEISRTGGDAERCHRIGVYYTDPETRRRKHVTVTIPLPGEVRTRDADPIMLDKVEATTSAAALAEAEKAGEDALIQMAAVRPPSGTATVFRAIQDHHTGEMVEPWEIVPGSLCMIESTGEVLRITQTSVDLDENGVACEVTIGDPDQTLEDRMIALLRGEIDPRKSLIGSPTGPTKPVPPPLGAPTHHLKKELDDVAQSVADDFLAVYNGLEDGSIIGEGAIDYLKLGVGALTAYLVNGRVIQTYDDGAPPWTLGHGLKLSSSGLLGYPAIGAASPTFAFDTATGRAHLTGGMSTGTGYDDITITPGNAFEASALEFWTNSPYYDNSNGYRAGISCFDATDGTDHLVRVRLHGPKMSTKGTRPRIDMVTTRKSSGDVEADVEYHAGGDPSGPGVGAHWFIIDGYWKVAVGGEGITMADGTQIGIGLPSWTVPNNGITALGPIKSGARMDVDSGFFDQSVAIGANGAWQGAAVHWNSSGRLAVAPSTERAKQDIEPLSLDLARRALDLQPVTFRYRPEVDMGDDLHPGFIAEQAEAAGLGLWVRHDAEGRPAGFRYAELVAAQNALIRDLYERVAALEEAA